MCHLNFPCCPYERTARYKWNMAPLRICHLRPGIATDFEMSTKAHKGAKCGRFQHTKLILEAKKHCCCLKSFYGCPFVVRTIQTAVTAVVDVLLICCRVASILTQKPSKWPPMRQKHMWLPIA